MELEGDARSLLILYRQALDLPRHEFQGMAVRMLQRTLRFESCIWGNGYLAATDGAAPHLFPIEVHTHEIDPAGFQRWKEINRADKVIPIVLAAPGETHNFHAPTLFSRREDAVMRDYAHEFGRQSYLITAFGRKESTVREWCSVYRPDPADQFTDAERQRCQILSGHMHQAP